MATYVPLLPSRFDCYDSGKMALHSWHVLPPRCVSLAGQPEEGMGSPLMVKNLSRLSFLYGAPADLLGGRRAYFSKIAEH